MTGFQGEQQGKQQGDNTRSHFDPSVVVDKLDPRAVEGLQVVCSHKGHTRTTAARAQNDACSWVRPPLLTLRLHRYRKAGSTGGGGRRGAAAAAGGGGGGLRGAAVAGSGGGERRRTAADGGGERTVVEAGPLAELVIPRLEVFGSHAVIHHDLRPRTHLRSAQHIRATSSAYSCIASIRARVSRAGLRFTFSICWHCTRRRIARIASGEAPASLISRVALASSCCRLRMMSVQPS